MLLKAGPFAAYAHTDSDEVVSCKVCAGLCGQFSIPGGMFITYMVCINDTNPCHSWRFCVGPYCTRARPPQKGGFVNHFQCKEARMGLRS